MLNFKRNNLDKVSSPYLQQHKNNPIYWQEWSQEVLDYSKKNNKLIFVSIGYATCHWCHVMATEAFSNKEIAEYLNEHFVSIKVDREQRPDIDKYMMSFIVETQGSGGWPLNVILTHDLKPIYALTYAPINPKYGLPGFIAILKMIKEGYEQNKEEIATYSPSPIVSYPFEETQLIISILELADMTNGGFGHSIKFPPHNTLLFLLSYFEAIKDYKVKEIIELTLDHMAKRGLHDHLQGGFYRYCTDNQWTIPHFEKMLYDQAMLLWVYSWAYKLLNKDEYKVIINKIVQCLEETFEHNKLFYSAHDADANHEEGTTYLWSKEELQKVLTKEEFERFIEAYEISDKGNFEGKIHLIKKENIFLAGIEAKLLEIRKTRNQPFIDRKIVTSWNALTGIALLMAYRCINNEKAKTKSLTLFKNILSKHYINNKLAHSSINNTVQQGEFLEDYASLLLFATYIYEETNKYKEVIEELTGKLKEFQKNNTWIESKNPDFMEVAAQRIDHPIPSSASLAEFAIFRTKLIFREDYEPGNYEEPMNYDFFNLITFLKNGNVHEIHVPKKISWKHLPLNCIQLISKNIQDCYKQICVEFKNVNQLFEYLKK